MGNGERRMRDAEAGGDLGGAAVVLDRGLPARFPDDLDLKPAHTVADACAQCLGARLLGGKPRGETFRGITFAQAICLLAGRVDAVEEAGPIAVNGLPNPPDLRQIDSAANDHSVYQAKSSLPARGLVE